MGARTKYRKRALDLLYEADLRGLSPDGTLAERIERNQPPINAFTADLVRGVAAHLEQIDALIAENAKDWTIERMPAVDRNLLRIAVFEILYSDDVPNPVVVAEAVALATELSTDDSSGFVNGLLAQIIAINTTAEK